MGGTYRCEGQQAKIEDVGAVKSDDPTSMGEGQTTTRHFFIVDGGVRERRDDVEGRQTWRGSTKPCPRLWSSSSTTGWRRRHGVRAWSGLCDAAANRVVGAIVRSGRQGSMSLHAAWYHLTTMHSMNMNTSISEDGGHTNAKGGL